MQQKVISLIYDKTDKQFAQSLAEDFQRLGVKVSLQEATSTLDLNNSTKVHQTFVCISPRALANKNIIAFISAFPKSSSLKVLMTVDCYDILQKKQFDHIRFVGKNIIECMSGPSQVIGDLISELREVNKPQYENPSIFKRDLSLVPELGVFVDRALELRAVKDAIINKKVKLITLFGMGGVGKSKLAVTLTKDEDVREYFSSNILWISLAHPRPAQDVAKEILEFIHRKLPSLNSRDIIDSLVENLDKQRYLIVIDDFQSVLDFSVEDKIYFSKEFDAYAEFLEKIVTWPHQSCFVITSRYKLDDSEGVENLPGMYSMQLGGLDTPAIKQFYSATLPDIDLSGLGELDELHKRTAGIPIVLKVISEQLKTRGIRKFLEDGLLNLKDVDEMLSVQFEKLNMLEKELTYWVMIGRDHCNFDFLMDNVITDLPSKHLMSALSRLVDHHSFAEVDAAGNYKLLPVVEEFIRSKFVHQVSTEIETEKIGLLSKISLFTPAASEYVRRGQIELIIMPIGHYILSKLGKTAAKNKFITIIQKIRENTIANPFGYCAGNILNIMLQAGLDVSGLDLSKIQISRALLTGVNLHDVNFSSSDLSQSVLAEAFGGIISLSFSPTDDYLVAGTSNGEVKIWTTKDFSNVSTCVGHTDWVRGVGFIDENTIISAGGDKSIRIWDLMGKELFRYPAHMGGIRGISLSKTGLVASASSDKTVKLWSLSRRELLASLEFHEGEVNCVAFSPDGSLIASGGQDRRILIWDVAKGNVIAQLIGHSARIQTLAFNPKVNAELVSGSEDGYLSVWDISTQSKRAGFLAHTNGIRHVAYSPNGEFIASAGDDKVVRIWKAASLKLSQNIREHSDQVRTAVFSHDGKYLASGGDDHSIYLWDVISGECLRVVKGYTNTIWTLGVGLVSNKIVSGADDRSVRIWNTAGVELKSLEKHDKRVRSVAVNDKLIASAGDGGAIIWQPESDEWFPLVGHEGLPQAISISCDGQLVATGDSDGNIGIWSSMSGECLRMWKGHDNQVRSICFHAKKLMLASGSSDQLVKIWDVQTGIDIRTLHGHTSPVWALDFHPSRNLLASGSTDKTILLWNVKSGTLLRKIESPEKLSIRVLAFSPSADIMAIGSEQGIVELYKTSGIPLSKWKAHLKPIRAIKFVSDGKELVTSGDEGLIKIWDLENKLCLKTLTPKRPYENMNISDISGISETQRMNLRQLGAK